MSVNLLINEPPLQVIPSLAVKIGLNEALVLQQVHYWLQRSTNYRDGYMWVYNSYSNWQADNFPFWSAATVKRAFKSLEKQGLLISANYNRAGFDKTKWYRIDYNAVENLERVTNDEVKMTQRADQNDPTSRSNCTDGADQFDQTNTRDYQRLPRDSLTETSNEYYKGNLKTGDQSTGDQSGENYDEFLERQKKWKQLQEEIDSLSIPQ